MEKKEYKYSNITEKIIGCALRVHSKMRSGYQETIYQKCLEIEFRKIDLPFREEAELIIFYSGIAVGKRRVDFLVESKIVVEIKAINTLDNTHLAQCLNYLESFNLEVGLLINFGARSLEIKRIINSK